MGQMHDDVEILDELLAHSQRGQITADPRMIVKAETKPENSMISVTTKISIASTALGTIGVRGRGTAPTRWGDRAVTGSLLCAA